MQTFGNHPYKRENLIFLSNFWENFTISLCSPRLFKELLNFGANSEKYVESYVHTILGKFPQDICYSVYFNFECNFTLLIKGYGTIPQDICVTISPTTGIIERGHFSEPHCPWCRETSELQAFAIIHVNCPSFFRDELQNAGAYDQSDECSLASFIISFHCLKHKLQSNWRSPPSSSSCY